MSSVSEEINLDSIIARPSDLPTADVCGEVVMMNLDKGKYYALDAVGSRIWTLIETPQSVGAVVQSIVMEYEVEEQTCMKDVLVFINRLSEQGLLRISESK